MNDIPKLRRILEENRVIAVVGLSAKRERPSHFVSQYLLDHGYRVIPVNPSYTEVLGQKCYPALRDVPEKIDIVDCFRKSTEIMPIARDAIAVGAKVLWMQISVVNEAAADEARKAGLEVVMDRCIEVEHARLLGGR